MRIDESELRREHHDFYLPMPSHNTKYFMAVKKSFRTLNLKFYYAFVVTTLQQDERIQAKNIDHLSKFYLLMLLKFSQENCS